jgi:hypothetical protein
MVEGVSLMQVGPTASALVLPDLPWVITSSLQGCHVEVRPRRCPLCHHLNAQHPGKVSTMVRRTQDVGCGTRDAGTEIATVYK